MSSGTPAAETAKVVQIDKRQREERIGAACNFIFLQLGREPPRDQAEEIARGYGEEYVSEILERVYGGSP